MTRRIRIDSPIIYIAGPYTADDPVMRDVNVRNADRVAREIVAIGKELGLAVRTFVPHRLYHGWEEDERGIGSYEFIMQICQKWLLLADAIYIFAPSPGANQEEMLAKKKGIQVLKTLQETREWLMIIKKYKDQRKDNSIIRNIIKERLFKRGFKAKSISTDI